MFLSSRVLMAFLSLISGRPGPRAAERGGGGCPSSPADPAVGALWLRGHPLPQLQPDGPVPVRVQQARVCSRGADPDSLALHPARDETLRDCAAEAGAVQPRREEGERGDREAD